MKILAWDTSSKEGSVGAFEASEAGVEVRCEWTLNVEAVHSEKLLWAIHQVLEAARWKLGDVDYLMVGAGPGSFTGLRIGVTTGRTLAWSLKKPLIGVSSLSALAQPVGRWVGSALVVGVTNACKGELFAIVGTAPELEECLGNSFWHSNVQESAIAPEELQRNILSRLGSEQHWIAVGPGREMYPELWNGLPLERELPRVQTLGPRAREIAEMGWKMQSLGSLEPVFPRYLRASNAELKLRAGELQVAKGLWP